MDIGQLLNTTEYSYQLPCRQFNVIYSNEYDDFKFAQNFILNCA